MVRQSESNDIFFSEFKAKERMITGSSDLLSLFQWENKNVHLITMGSLSFGIEINISSGLLCPTILIFPHPTLQKVILILPHSNRNQNCNIAAVNHKLSIINN